MKYHLVLSLVVIITAGSGFATEPPRSKTGAGTRPLNYQNVISFFKEAHLRATEVQKRCTLFFEGEWQNADIYNYCLVIVENSDEDVQVTFYLTDAHEMNWVTEFVDGRFFTQTETKKLFDLIHSDHSVRAGKIGRYRVDFHHWQPRHAQILVFSFTPIATNKG